MTNNPARIELSGTASAPDLEPPATPQPSARLRLRARTPGMQLLSLCTIITLVLAWWLLTDVTGVVKELYFPSIHESVEAVNRLGSTLASAAGATAYRMVISWAIGCAGGIAVGLIMARSRLFYYVVNPMIEALRPVPVIALIPFTLVWFGLSDTGRIVLGVLVAFMTLVVTTYNAARNLQPIYIRAAQSLGASQSRIYWTVVLRAIFPQLVAALRVAAALNWGVIVAAEFMGAQSGIGELVLTASNAVNTPVVLVGTITVTVEAALFELLLRLVTSRMTRWVERQR